MQFKFFVGIDVSKATLDFSIVEAGVELKNFTIQNSPKAIKAAVKDMKTLKGFGIEFALFCVEQTGIYNNHLTTTLHSLDAKVWVEKAIQIKRSTGLHRGKSDKVDARRIAFYAFRNSDVARIWKAPRSIIQKLKRLTAVRDRLLKMVAQASKPIKESKKFDSKEVFNAIKNICSASIKAIKADIKKTDKMILETIKSDPSLKYLFDLITSVQGVGKVIACEVIITQQMSSKI
jgi:transposase